METVPEKIQKLVKLIGLRGASVEFDEESKRISITADEGEWFKKLIPELVRDFKHIINLMAKKAGTESFFVDINNYRKEREKLIIELAKAAAQKAKTTKEAVSLPAMNAYERRLVHVELSMRPDVKTVSSGEGKERGVVVEYLE